jgi:hypothetical protein
MIALVVALALASQDASAPDASAPGSAQATTSDWCTTAMLLATAPPAAAGAEEAAFDALVTAMPRDAAPVVARARELAGEEGLERSMAVLSFAVVDACATGAVAAHDVAAAQAAALMNDPRFSGIRKGDGTFDRLMHKAYLWFIALFESEAMQKYAGGSRVVFLSLIAVGAIALTVMTLRKRRREIEAAGGAHGDVVKREAERQEAYATLRAHADALLAQGDPRASMRAADAALLARVGELDRRAGIAKGDERIVTVARTHREIAARLPAHVSAVVRPPFATFDALFFGKPQLVVDDARAFLTAVDEAERALTTALAAHPAGGA